MGKSKLNAKFEWHALNFSHQAVNLIFNQFFQTYDFKIIYIKVWPQSTSYSKSIVNTQIYWDIPFSTTQHKKTKIKYSKQKFLKLFPSQSFSPIHMGPSIIFALRNLFSDPIRQCPFLLPSADLSLLAFILQTILERLSVRIAAFRRRRNWSLNFGILIFVAVCICVKSSNSHLPVLLTWCDLTSEPFSHTTTLHRFDESLSPLTFLPSYHPGLLWSHFISGSLSTTYVASILG